MAVGFVSSSASGSSDAFVSSLNVPVPSSTAANHIAVVAIERWGGTNPVITAPSGFTEKINLVSGDQKLHVWWKRLTGADSGNYSFSWTGSQWTMGHCMLFSGAVTSGDPFGSNTNTATASGTSTPTTTVAPAYAPGLVHFVANENSATATPPTNYAEAQDGQYLHSNYRILGTSGSTSASGGTLSASTLQLAALLAIQPASGGSSVAANTATETDSAFSFGKAKRGTANTATETDTAVSIGKRKTRAIGLAAETDAALTFGKAKARALGLTAETDTALPIGRGKSKPIGTAVETGTALAFGRSKFKGIGISLEIDTALAFGSTSGISQLIETALETDVALPIGHRRSKAIGTAFEFDTAGSISIINPAWRLVMPTIRERHRLRGQLFTSVYREVTVFGDEAGLFTSDNGYIAEGADEYGAIPFGTKYIWHGGHINVTTDPAIRNLWIEQGFEVEVVPQ